MAFTGAAALEQCREKAFDIVLLDFNRPDMPVFSPDGGKLAVPRENEVTVALLGGWRDRLSLPLNGRPSGPADTARSAARGRDSRGRRCR